MFSTANFMSLQKYAHAIAKKAKEASTRLANASSADKNRLLLHMADALVQANAALIKANEKDIAFARKAKLSEALIDRLRMDAKRIGQMGEGLRQVAGLPDPVGEVMASWKRPNGMQVEKVRVPLGVVFMIYESRPNVTADAAALCLKSGNAVILRGGKEAIHSNIKIAEVLKQSCKACGFSPEMIQLAAKTDHALIDHLLKLSAFIDLVIPRGGEALIRKVAATSKIPVIKHFKGLCIVYVDRAADLNMAESIVVNAKAQRPGTCNAMETLLVHRDVASHFLPRVAASLAQKGVEIRACPVSRKILPRAKRATEKDFKTEFLGLTMAVKTVKDLDEALGHIARYGSHHSDAIVTSDSASAERFTREVDSSAVFVNASTRLNDGGEFGFGAEIGISTDKLHARGPMGLAELTSYKYVVHGSGQIRV